MTGLATIPSRDRAAGRRTWGL